MNNLMLFFFISQPAFDLPIHFPSLVTTFFHSWAFNFLIAFALLPVSCTTHMNRPREMMAGDGVHDCRLHRRRELTIPSSQPFCVVTFLSLDTSIFIQAAPCSPNKHTYLSKAASWQIYQQDSPANRGNRLSVLPTQAKVPSTYTPLNSKSCVVMYVEPIFAVVNFSKKI
jgi:hypothetical protein